LIPILIEAMQRHGHLDLDPLIRGKLLGISAATIDRILRPTRERIDGHRRRRTGMGSAIRRSIPVRTFADWGDPSPGFFEVDMVEHCGGPKHDGNFVHSLVLTDIATGWTECVALPVRNQSLVVQGIAKAASDLPFAMLGIDTDNDSAFMNQTVFDYCHDHRLTFTRSRAYKKNDQAWVEQKNGSIVRRLVGYGRLSGIAATRGLAQLYSTSRLYTNFFQPSFKLKSKRREGARVSKTYHSPKTPCERLLALDAISELAKVALREQFKQLDPVRLLQDIRSAQGVLASFAVHGDADQAASPATATVATFLQSLATAWESGEVRPTHRGQPGVPHWWRTRVDPFEHAWPILEHWLETELTVTAKELMARLATIMPDVYIGTTQLRTLQRRVKDWRVEQAKVLVLGHIRDSCPDGPAAAGPSGREQTTTHPE
ncbi:MAG: transposase, partial [Paralcaligenes sp.]